MNNNIKALVSSLTAAAIICAMCVSFVACTKANANDSNVRVNDEPSELYSGEISYESSTGESVPIEEPSIELDDFTKAKLKVEEDLAETLHKYSEELKAQGMEQLEIKAEVSLKKEEKLIEMAIDRMKKYDSTFESFKADSREKLVNLMEAVCDQLTNGTDVSLDDRAVFEIFLKYEGAIVGSDINKDLYSPYTDVDKLVEKIEKITNH